MIYTAEAVSKRHPDKICDQISDAILDACIGQDKLSRVAIEVIGGHNTVVLIGEITTKAKVDYAKVAKEYYKALVGVEIGVLSNIVIQSPEISQGVDTGGAGDQGIMIGYACDENKNHLPTEFDIARKLLIPFKTDGKSQVTITDGLITDVVLSVQNVEKQVLENWIINILGSKPKNMYCNNTGAFTIGGFDADSGCTGRKIVVDAYGPRVPVGGGAFSGKDPSKVDRSGAYMARFIALETLKYYEAKEVVVRLGYVIGKAEPIMKEIEILTKDNKIIREWPSKNYDCRPNAIIERFDLLRPIYLETAIKGHFGYKHYPWEQV